VYEGNKFENRNGKIYINGSESTQYTFKMDYFWMMGDNRHNSLDSRYWGFVPEDHVVGKASLIWFSWEGGPRWKRLFNGIK
jgi:signal peptidase I